MICPAVDPKHELPHLPNIEIEDPQERDSVAELIAKMDNGPVTKREFSEAIKHFSEDDLGRLSDELLLYYQRKCMLIQTQTAEFQTRQSERLQRLKEPIAHFLREILRLSVWKVTRRGSTIG